MIKNYYYKRKNKLFLLLFIILLFNLVSLIFLQNSVINLNDNFENFNDTPSIIRISSNNPPNKHYFEYYKTITINHDMVSGSGSHENFPVLISILDSDLHNHVNQSSGNDIAFSNDTDWLDHEIEYFNRSYSGTHAQLIAWIRIPNLSTLVNTTIYMYYGNSTMNSRQNPTGVWDTSYRGVWHFSELSGSVIDSTSFNRSGSVSGTVSRNEMGQIDRAYDFGNNGQINYGDPSDGHLDMGTGSFTISFWMNIDASTETYQLPLYKGATTYDEAGYDFETNEQAVSLSFHICDGQNMGEAGGFEINYDNWAYVTGVVDRSSNYMRLYKDGSQVSSTVSISSVESINNSLSLYTPTEDYDLNGLLDEIRICSVARTSGWILTEYNNQDDPGTFFSLGTEIIIDNIPPFYSDLIESSDPLELGETEIIEINVSDPSGINQVRIEFESSNHSMINTVGNTWEYDSWTPNSVGNYTYRIWMEDNYYNWNSTMGTVEVIDITPPTYADLIESADPLQFGQNETIEIRVFDLSGINQTLIEYDSNNHSMEFQGGNKWSWNKWQPTIGVHSYKIYMQDNQNNWNITTGDINVVSIYAPFIENLTEIKDPLELGNDIIISVDVYDNETWVSSVLIELDGINRTMNNILGDTYEYSWNSSEYIESGYLVGSVSYKIYANDSDNNWNSLSSSFDIEDTIAPNFSDLIESEDPLELGSTVIISVNSTDLSDINLVKIYFEGSNHSMINIGNNTWQYDQWVPSATGNCLYTIWAEDNNNNWNFISDSILVRDTTIPSFSNLTESANPVELGTVLTISIKAIDLADIKEILIEYENLNHSMSEIGGDTWCFDSWIPNSKGNYTYKIYIRDNNENLNHIISWILFIDTIMPDYDYLIENSDPLELGDNQIIRINTYDFAGINQCLIEFEGANHSMINIYGNTWQFDSWIPNNWTFYHYKIYIEDKSGNWNFVIGNITVQDTTFPSPPILTNAPSGDVSGNILFDWLDGSDPSGISYYILIIDNETDPSITPGYIYKINITNTGSESSYYELTEKLPKGKYYYFLAQIDGIGHQSDYTMGSFTFKLDPNDNSLMIYIIIAVIVVSAGGSIGVITIVRKKAHKKMGPPKKKVPFKVILGHITKLLPPELISEEKKLQNAIIQEGETPSHTKELPDEVNIEINIDEIKFLGEELFSEGAYLEAIKKFQHAKDLLSKQGRNEEAVLISDLILGIEGLIEEREKRIEFLETEKIKGTPTKIFELYYDIVEISKKLRDLDAISMFQSELIQYFQINKFKLKDMENYRSNLEHEADYFSNNGNFEMAAQIYGKCEEISQLLVKLEKQEEIVNVEKFRNKKNECLEHTNLR
jgi:hypothetical protein